MMVRRMAMVAGAASLLAAAGSASAQLKYFTSSLDGSQEVPPRNTPATGEADVVLNTATGEVSVLGTYQGLIGGPSTMAHIHGLAPPGANAGIIVHLTHSFATSGTISGNGVLNQTQIDGMLNGLTYLNIHNGVFPGGEIRGQILLVPSPAGVGALALAGLAALRRRR